MNIRLLNAQDVRKLEEYLAPHQAECMFICSNLRTAGIEYKNADYEGEYFGCFANHNVKPQELLGVIVHYWNDNIMMHASNHTILEQLTWHLKNNTKRPVAAVLGSNNQAEHVIKNLGLADAYFNTNRNEGLYEINLAALKNLSIPSNCEVIAAQDLPKSVLMQWMKNYNVEALGASNDDALEKHVEENWTRRLQQNDSWILLSEGVPVSLPSMPG